MQLPLYLLQNHDRIINSPEQQIFLWNVSYDKYRKDYPVVERIYQRFPNRNLQRKDVVELFKEDLYTGFIASMMWGGINATRPATKEGTDTCFRKLLDHPQDIVEAAIIYAEQQIITGNFYELFLAFSPGEALQIPGVGYAYFTKLFFFFGQVYDASVKPLIFDKWLTNAHCALTIQLLDMGETVHYTGINPHYAYSVKLPISKIKKAQLYHKFVTDINCWTNELNKIPGKSKITPAKVEEFLFGQSLMQNRHYSNPRLELWEIIENYFAPNGEKIEIKKQPNPLKPVKVKIIREVKNEGIHDLKVGSRYYFLQEHLRQCALDNENEVILTINQIEEILSENTPVSLPNWGFTRAPGFWGNSGYREHVQKAAWLSQGYRASPAKISPLNKTSTITFTRMVVV